MAASNRNDAYLGNIRILAWGADHYSTTKILVEGGNVGHVAMEMCMPIHLIDESIIYKLKNAGVSIKTTTETRGKFNGNNQQGEPTYLPVNIPIYKIFFSYWQSGNETALGDETADKVYERRGEGVEVDQDTVNLLLGIQIKINKANSSSTLVEVIDFLQLLNNDSFLQNVFSQSDSTIGLIKKFNQLSTDRYLANRLGTSKAESYNDHSDLNTHLKDEDDVIIEEIKACPKELIASTSAFLVKNKFTPNQTLSKNLEQLSTVQDIFFGCNKNYLLELYKNLDKKNITRLRQTLSAIPVAALKETLTPSRAGMLPSLLSRNKDKRIVYSGPEVIAHLNSKAKVHLANIAPRLQEIFYPDNKDKVTEIASGHISVELFFKIQARINLMQRQKVLYLMHTRKTIQLTLKSADSDIKLNKLAKLKHEYYMILKDDFDLPHLPSLHTPLTEHDENKLSQYFKNFIEMIDEELSELDRVKTQTTPTTTLRRETLEEYKRLAIANEMEFEKKDLALLEELSQYTSWINAHFSIGNNPDKTLEFDIANRNIDYSKMLNAMLELAENKDGRTKYRLLGWNCSSTVLYMMLAGVERSRLNFGLKIIKRLLNPNNSQIGIYSPKTVYNNLKVLHGLLADPANKSTLTASLSSTVFDRPKGLMPKTSSSTPSNEIKKNDFD